MRPVPKADNKSFVVMKSGNLNFLEPSWPLQASNGTALPFYSNRGKSPNMGRCFISYQEVLSSLFKNVNHQADETVLCNHSIKGHLLRTSVLIGRLCFGSL